MTPIQGEHFDLMDQKNKPENNAALLPKPVARIHPILGKKHHSFDVVENIVEAQVLEDKLPKLSIKFEAQTYLPAQDEEQSPEKPKLSLKISETKDEISEQSTLPNLDEANQTGLFYLVEDPKPVQRKCYSDENR